MPPVQNRNFRPRTDLSVLIDAIRAEGRASLAEERREDRGKRLREWVTIGVITATLMAIVAQVREMRRAYEPIEQQAKASIDAAKATKEAADAALKQVEDAENALKLDQRAWIGPNNVSLSAEPAAGKPVDVSITYQNTGREPALDFIYDVDPFLIGREDDATAALARIGSYRHACLTTSRLSGGSVIYPATGFSSYNLSTPVPAGTFDASFLKGQKLLIVQGCFWYHTFKMQKHSYFCYFYDPKRTKFANLNICTVGADAN